MNELNQMELKMNANLDRRPSKPLPRSRAKWWFDQMRKAANSASRWPDSTSGDGSKPGFHLTQAH